MFEKWRALQQACGGDFSGQRKLPSLVCGAFSGSFPGTDGAGRIVHWPPLDADEDDDPDRLRVVQVVTSLQRGGAERVTWDLHDVLPMQGVASRLVTLGRPLRRSLPDPPGRVDLSKLDFAARAAAVEEVAARFGADVIHAHLIRRDDAVQFAQSGVPLVMTVHNMSPGWPEGLAALPIGIAALLVPCARAVERELRDANLPGPIRTAWNGIDVGSFCSVPRNVDPKCLILACVANPRLQKRLHLLPAVLAALRAELARRGDVRDARLVIAGEMPTLRESSQAGPAEPSDVPRNLGGSPDGRNGPSEVIRAAESHGVADRIEWTGGERDVRHVLRSSDVLVSLSAHEGLSLAHLEALAAGVPVVATGVGGTAELAHANPAVTLLPADVLPDEVARAVVDAAGATPAGAGVEAVRRDFSRERMVARYAWLYRAVHGPGRGETLWFVANNLCTGGAQSSLRRLVKAFHADGVRVRVAVLQEHEAYSTPGREDLLQAGVPVTVFPPAGEIDAADAVRLLLGEMCADAPRSVIFWNAIQSYKLLIADALLHVPVFDVSPGEMFYDSLDAYFARPRSGLPYRCARDYGERLAGVVVKYAAEAEVARQRLGAPVHVIPNGVPLPGQSAANGQARNGRLVIGTACRIHPHKRLDDLIDAFRLAVPLMPPAVLRVAGAPDSGCEQFAAELRERGADLPVEWLGGLPAGSGAAFHAGLDVFAMISEPAGCPNASLEAMAAGLPVIATDVGGASEQVVDGVTGRLVPRRDAKLFAQALIELAGCADCRARMGAESRRRIEERFTVERMARDYRVLLA